MSEVRLRGYLTVGNGTNVFYLPPGYRPAYNCYYGARALTTAGVFTTTHCMVWTDGSVAVAYSGLSTVILDGISFRAEQ